MDGEIRSFKRELLEKLKLAVHEQKADVAEILIQKLQEVSRNENRNPDGAQEDRFLSEKPEPR